LLQVAQVQFGYGSRSVLHDIDLTVAAGQMLCVLGKNGAGKSTLLKLCAGIVYPQAGRIHCAGRLIAEGSTKPKNRLSRAAIAQHIAYLPQDSGHTFPFTALEVVLMGRYARARHSFETAEDLQAAEAAMAQTDVWPLRDRPLSELSGGERRRVLLAQALAQDTQLVLLDEPTAGLDPSHALAIGQAMTSVCAQGKALIWTTHDLNLAARFAPQATLLHEGTLALSGTTLEVLSQAGPLLGIHLHLGHLPSGIPFAVPT
jgi:iron complex transport system ATP-binding protein